MRKDYGTLLLCGLTAALGLGSCVSTSDDLDLDKKKLSLDMRLAPGGLKIPVGSLNKIYIDSLIKINDDSALDTLESGLYGITMDGTIKKVEVDIDDVTIDIPNPDIDPISSKFDDTDIDDVEITGKSQKDTLKITSVTLETINSSLPKLENTYTASLGVEIPVTPGFSFGPFNIPVPTRNVDCNFEYLLPKDVKSLNKVVFGDPNSASGGQKLTLNVDLSPFYAVTNDPKITVKSLSIQFPDNFKISANSDLNTYISADYVTVSNNSFSINMPDGVYVTGTAATESLPISFNVDEADFSNYGSETIDGTQITYQNQLSYSLNLTISGTSTESGKFTPGVNVGITETLQMADFSVDTNDKTISLEKSSIVSSFNITDLDKVKEVKTVDFDPEKSYIQLGIGDFDITPFKFDESSAITLTFPSTISFVKRNDKLVFDGATEIGKWDDVSDNTLKIWPGQAKGKTIVLNISSLDVQQKVVNQSITINNTLEYSGDITIAAAKNLDKSALDVLNNKELSFAYSGNLKVTNASVVTDKIETTIDDTTYISIDEEIDKALKEVSTINLSKAAAMSVGLKFQGIPQTIEKLTFSDVTIEFPDFLKLSYSGTDTRVSYQDGKLTIDGDLTREKGELSDNGNGFVIQGLKIEGMEFSQPQKINSENHLVLADQEVRIKGTVSVDGQTVNSGDMDEITVIPNVSFESVKVKSILGKVDPEIDPIHEDVELSLGSDIDFLKNEGNQLTLSDPEICISLTSTVTVPINLKLSLSSTDSDNKPIAEGIVPDENDGIIQLPACPVEDEQRVTTIVIYKETMPSTDLPNPIYVQMSRLSDLMTTIPDKIQFDLTAKADTSNACEVDITRELTVEGKYDVQVPLSFNDLYMEYNDTIKDLGDNLKDVADKIESAEIFIDAKALSTIPLGVTITAVPLDYKNREIRDISIEKCLIKAGSKEGTEVDVHIAVDLKKKGALEKLEAIAFKAACESVEGKKSSIQKGQNVYLHDIVLDMPNGIDVDFTDKKDE